MYVSLYPPALPGNQVLVGAKGCLERTSSLGNLKTGTPTWSPQGVLKTMFEFEYYMSNKCSYYTIGPA